MSNDDSDHVRIRPLDGQLEIFCEGCKAFERMTLPVSVEDIGKSSTAFIDKHLDCSRILSAHQRG